MADHAIPFKIPEKFKDAVKRGAVRRVGTLLMSNDGEGSRIVGHLQEAGGFPRPSLPTGPLSMITEGGKLVSAVGQNIQLEQVKSSLSTLKLMSSATLGASLVGIGVSVAGFAMLNSKVNQVNARLASVSEDALETRITADQIARRQGARDRAPLSAMLHEAEEAWLRSNPTAIWTDIASRLLVEDHYYREFVIGAQESPNIFLDPNISFEESATAFEALHQVGSARLKTLLLLNEMDAALGYAEDLSSWTEDILSKISPAKIKQKKVELTASRAEQDPRDIAPKLLRASEQFMARCRQLEVNAETRPKLLETLIEKGIDGHEYIASLRGEDEQPVLVLEA